MPMHDWTRVDAGIYHDFDQAWIAEIKRELNRGLLPQTLYALTEQYASGFGPDVLTLRGADFEKSGGTARAVVPARPQTMYTVKTPADFYLQKQNAVAIRHVSGDRVVAVVELMSPGNKSSVKALAMFLKKAEELLNAGVHLLVVDPFPPGPRDPDGVHTAIWATVDEAAAPLPRTGPLTLASYECGAYVEGFIEMISVGDAVPDMPLFLEPGQYITLPLEATYQAAWDTVPARWQRVIAA
jgi:hypothetical protein